MGCILSPFKMIWSFLGMLLGLLGRLLCAVIGIALMIAGTALCLTVIGAIAGAPLLVVGLLMVVKSLFP